MTRTSTEPRLPRDLEEAAAWISWIGEAQGAINTIQDDLNSQIRELQARAMAESEPLEHRIRKFMDGLQAFAREYRPKLTRDGRIKIVEVPTGYFGWRLSPPSVRLRRKVAALIADLKMRGKLHLLRVRETLNRKAIIEHPEEIENVEGISIGRSERFVVKPNKLSVEITPRAQKLTREAKGRPAGKGHAA